MALCREFVIVTRAPRAARSVTATVSKSPCSRAPESNSRAPVALCDFASVSHYFNTLALRGFVLIDTLTVRRTADLFEAPRHVGCSDKPGGVALPASLSSAR